MHVDIMLDLHVYSVVVVMFVIMSSSWSLGKLPLAQHVQDCLGGNADRFAPVELEVRLPLRKGRELLQGG